MSDMITPKIEQIANDILNHRKFRYKVIYSDKELYHLMLPLDTWIFTFVYDSEFKRINQFYNIDVHCKQIYGSEFCYPLLLLINSKEGLQKIANETVFFPNKLFEFANMEAKNDQLLEENVDNEEVKQFEKQYTLQTSSSTDVDLKALFGSIFAEA